MTRIFLSIFVLFVFASVIITQSGCGKKAEGASNEQMIQRGAYLVNLGGCNHCHSPKLLTPEGPVPDKERLLSGFSQDGKLEKWDPATGKNWILTNMELTAWVGPWGVSYAANLTPDNATGIGTWTDEIFMKAMRSGKHMGAGRMILPPMPWQDIGKSTDDDLKSIFAYLKSLPAVRNAVPSPTPPSQTVSAK